jgi:hypothetical protein
MHMTHAIHDAAARRSEPRSHRRSALALAVALSAALVASSALAQDKKGAPAGGGSSQKGVITLAEVTITGRIQKPIAAVDVARIAPKLTLAELRQPFLDRIEQAIYKDPF